MNSESNYIKTLDKVVSKLKRMHEQADAVRWLYDNGDVEGSYRHALKLEEISEEAAYIAHVNASIRNYEIAVRTDRIQQLVSEMK